MKKDFRLVMDGKGRLTISEIDANENSLKICKIVGKTALKGGKVQYNLHDGKNLLTKEKAKVGDTLLIGLPKLEVKKILPLKIGVKVFLTKGKHAGSVGTLKEIRGKEAIYSVDGKDIETAKAYLFVVGDKESEIKIN